MRLTKKDFNYKAPILNKLGQLEDIEEEFCIYGNDDLRRRLKLADKYGELSEELGIDLITLFSQKYEQRYDLEVEKDEKTIYFCGDSYYGHWTKEQWLNFIKEVISAYRELVKLGRWTKKN